MTAEDHIFSSTFRFLRGYITPLTPHSASDSPCPDFLILFFVWLCSSVLLRMNQTAETSTICVQFVQLCRLFAESFSFLSQYPANFVFHLQVRSQNELIDGMEGQMFDAGGLLGGTLRRISTMMAKGGSRHMCYLVAFIVFTFIAIWWILKHATSGR